MLIRTARHTAADLALWESLEDADILRQDVAAYRARYAEALHAIAAFTSAGECYAGISWGKDSTVLAHLIQCVAPDTPLAWTRVEPIANPDCVLVRDAFLRLHPHANYHEITEWCEWRDGEWHATGTLESGIAKCRERWGERTILGIRAEESTQRGFRIWRHGLSTDRSCDPLGRWRIEDVMTCLAIEGLPVHPAYAMLGGGRWPREQLRVSSLGGRRGDGLGRAEWEREYYGDVVRRLAMTDT